MLPLDEGLTRLRMGSLPPRSVVITFDDGFVDFATEVFPALQSFGYPSTVYLTTHYCSYPFPVSNLMLDYLLWKSGVRRIAFPEFGMKQEMRIEDLKMRVRVAQRIEGWMKENHLDTTAKNDILCRLARRLEIDYALILEKRLLQVMNGNEVNRLARSGVDFQLHTHRHRTPHRRAEFEKEIEDNRKRLIQFTGKRPEHFCYPSGKYAPELAEWLPNFGIASATTCETGLARPNSDPFSLPRVLDTNTMSEARFEALVAGLIF